jgi:hypothetical protein
LAGFELDWRMLRRDAIAGPDVDLELLLSARVWAYAAFEYVVPEG